MHPGEVTRGFAEAISAAELDRATSLFAEDGCFITPDATTVHGRRGIKDVLAQLTASRVRLSVAPEGIRVDGAMALCHERWAFTYAGGHGDSYTQISHSTILLRRSDHDWRLMIVAPWHTVAPVGVDVAGSGAGTGRGLAPSTWSVP
jgi:uncharacterized protein (TIGR02246 family)